MPRPTPSVPADLQELSGRFEDWRRTRRGKLPIAEPLWAAATELARSHGVRQAGAPIDNDIVERALKKAILNRKNALLYKTVNGAGVGDLFMSLIHTCELNPVNPFDYLTDLLQHPGELKQHPSEWMSWNYRDTLERLATPEAA